MDAGWGQAWADDGTAIGYRVAGQGPVLLMVHSAAADARQWAHLVPRLVDEVTTVCMERRGRGRSGPYGSGHSLAVEYGDIVAVAAAFDEPVHLLGHSSGARFALHAAPRIDGLASLMLYEPPAPENLSEALLQALDALAEAGDRRGVLRGFFVDGVGMEEDDFPLLAERPVWPIMLDNALTLPAELRAVRDYRFDPSDVDTLEAPALLLLGETTEAEVATVTREVAAALPRAEVRLLAGQGHGAMFSAPELLASEIRRFVAAAGATG